jgi:alpha-tubulin suppressor-like RCC1 family protein
MINKYKKNLYRNFNLSTFDDEIHINDLELSHHLLSRSLNKSTIQHSHSSPKKQFKFDSLYSNSSVSIHPNGKLHIDGMLPHYNKPPISDLINIIYICFSSQAFAALRHDGLVFTWGLPSQCYLSPDTQSKITNIGVKSIISNAQAFAALLNDNTVVSWGSPDFGGNLNLYPDIHSELQNVSSIHATCNSFAALCSDGSVISWGFISISKNDTGQLIFQHISSINNIYSIYSLYNIFVAIQFDGTLCSWGATDNDSIIPPILSDESVLQIIQGRSSIAILLYNGSVVTWRAINIIGNKPIRIIPTNLDNIKDIIYIVRHNIFNKSIDDLFQIILKNKCEIYC